MRKYSCEDIAVTIMERFVNGDGFGVLSSEEADEVVVDKLRCS